MFDNVMYHFRSMVHVNLHTDIYRTLSLSSVCPLLCIKCIVHIRFLHGVSACFSQGISQSAPERALPQKRYVGLRCHWAEGSYAR